MKMDKNNFNYTSVPEDLLYSDRRHLDDFGVEDSSSLNHIIEREIDRMYGSYPDYENFARDLFNTAYYICTMALVDSHPQRRFGAYLLIIDRKMRGRADEIGVVLSIVLAQLYAHKWDETNPNIDSLANKIFNEIDKNHTVIFYELYTYIHQEFEEGGEEKTVPPESDFLPREITMGVLKKTRSHWDWNNHFGTDTDKMLEFIFAIGKNEEEQRLIATFLEEETHPSFEKGADHKFCFEYIERKIYLKHHAAEENAEIEAQIDAEIEKEYEIQFELDYYRDEFPKLKADNENLRAEIEKMKNHNTATNDEKTNLDDSPLNARIAELEKENAELKATHTQHPVATNNEDIEELKKKAQLLAEKEAIIKEQERLIEDYSARFDPKDIRKRKVIAMTGKQHVILILSVLAHHERLPNSRKTMSSLMSFIASRNQSTMEDYLGDAISKEECDNLANVFENEKQPFIAGLIRELPEKLEKDKIEKNRTKALKKNND